MTTSLDRLERAGYVRRKRDRVDRRSVIVELTAKSVRRSALIWGPIARGGAHLLGTFSGDELAAILRFLEGSKNLQDKQARMLCDAPSPQRKGSRLRTTKG